MVSNKAKEYSVNIIRSVLSDIGTSSPSWVINWLIYKLIDSVTTSEDNIPLLEFCVYHDFCVFYILVAEVTLVHFQTQVPPSRPL